MADGRWQKQSGRDTSHIKTPPIVRRSFTWMSQNPPQNPPSRNAHAQLRRSTHRFHGPKRRPSVLQSSQNLIFVLKTNRPEHLPRPVLLDKRVSGEHAAYLRDEAYMPHARYVAFQNPVQIRIVILNVSDLIERFACCLTSAACRFFRRFCDVCARLFALLRGK